MRIFISLFILLMLVGCYERESTLLGNTHVTYEEVQLSDKQFNETLSETFVIVEPLGFYAYNCFGKDDYLTCYKKTKQQP